VPKWNLDLKNINLEQEVDREIIIKKLPGGTKKGKYTLRLSLLEFAPKDWDGKVWFGIGIQDVGAAKTFAVTLTNINES